MIMTMGINVKNLVKAFALITLVFSFSAIAQTTTDKAMEAKALAALVLELKGVVLRSSPDKNEAKLVGEKWDARKDLAGKTKSEVIELLFEDVKSVIKDAGTQYQIYSMFSFYKIVTVEAPTDKPLEAKALAVLIKELKGVITRDISDKKEVNLISNKWDVRKDLAGKSKKDVIQILFEDVRTVIKDYDTRVMVFEMFSFYEAIPDDSLIEQTQKTESEMSKSELVEELVRQTLRLSLHYGKPEYPMTPEEKKVSDIISKEFRIKGYEEALKENDKLTRKQKDFVRANYDKLFKAEDESYAGAEKTTTEQSTNQGVEESLRKSYKKFSPEELRSLIASFTGIKGQRYLENLNRLTFAESFFGSLDELGYAKAQKVEYKKFVESELGKKFSIAYFVEILANTESLDEAENLKNPDEDESLDYLQKKNKIINKFVAENYKK